MSRDVPEGWTMQGLREALCITPGYPFKSDRFLDDPEGGMPLVRIRDLIEQSPSVFTPEKCDNRYVVKQGDYLVGMDGEFIAVRWDGPTSVLNQRVLKIASSHQSLDSTFLYYRIQPELKRIEGRTGATTVKHLSTKDLISLEFALPPLPEQCRIAEILSSVDEAIAATGAVIEQTKKVKQGVLERLLTRGIGHTRFKRTEIGEIPEAWGISGLLELLREPVRNGYSPVCPKEVNGRWMLSLGSLSESGLNGLSLKPAPLFDSRLNQAQLEFNDIIISRSNTPQRVGMVGIYKGKPETCYFPDLMMRLRLEPGRISPEFAETWLRHLQSKGYFSSAASGTSASMLKINRDTLSRVLVPLPSLAEQAELTQQIAAIQKAADIEAGKQLSLLEIKSALMSDLLTGRKRVRETLLLAAE